MADDLGSLLKAHAIAHEEKERNIRERKLAEERSVEEKRRKTCSDYLIQLMKDITEDAPKEHRWNSTKKGMIFKIPDAVEPYIKPRNDPRYKNYKPLAIIYDDIWDHFQLWCEKHNITAEIEEVTHDERNGDDVWPVTDYYQMLIKAKST